MDFVFDLPVTSSGKSGIAVIVDKLSRDHLLIIPPKLDAVDWPTYIFMRSIAITGFLECYYQT
jgi:hypothetical protein